MKKQDLTLDVHILSRLTHVHYSSELRKLGITMGQFPFIMALYENDGISQERLSDSLKISKSTTTVVVRQLIEKNFVCRTVDASDRRNFRLALTEKGKALIPKIEKEILSCCAVLTEGFSKGERKMFEELLARARKNAETSLRP